MSHIYAVENKGAAVRVRFYDDSGIGRECTLARADALALAGDLRKAATNPPAPAYNSPVPMAAGNLELLRKWRPVSGRIGGKPYTIKKPTHAIYDDSCRKVGVVQKMGGAFAYYQFGDSPPSYVRGSQVVDDLTVYGGGIAADTEPQGVAGFYAALLHICGPDSPILTHKLTIEKLRC